MMNKFLASILVYLFSFTFCLAQTGSADIRLNQVGFYPNRPKVAIAVGTGAGPFYITSSDKQDTLFTGTLGNAFTWPYSGEAVRKADFSNFKSIGQYYILIPGLGYSHPFQISHQVHHTASKASIKSFYYQRASTSLPSAYAEIWTRTEGHPDTVITLHNSAKSFCKDPATDVLSIPGGWYDGTDYNKYVVTAGISTYCMMALYEHYPLYFDTIQTNIPESGNNLPDILNEVLWEIRWLLNMQDTCDGGVYTKLTTPEFAYTMPDADLQTRYVVKKSTAASLDFAAVMAQAARIFSNYSTSLPGLADSCIYQSLAAWNWARAFPNVEYKQSDLSNPYINTSAYPDLTFSDEFRWAAAELYTTTKLDSFYVASGSFNNNMNVPGWSDVNSLAYYTLSHYRKNLTAAADTANIKNKLVAFADQLKSESSSSAYGVVMGQSSFDFSWGSNGIASYQGMALMAAFDQTKDTTYLDAALTNLDYLLGRNATDYSFLTGFGEISPMHIHHHISEKDGITLPIPGLLAAGPQNADNQDLCPYPAGLNQPATKYFDDYCSYSTNKVAINYNASFAFLAGTIEAVEAKVTPSVITFPPFVIDPKLINGIKKASDDNIHLKVYPNPSDSELLLEFQNKGNSKVTLYDLAGKKIHETFFSQTGLVSTGFDLGNLAPGIYFVTVTNQKGSEVRKVIVQ